MVAIDTKPAIPSNWRKSITPWKEKILMAGYRFWLQSSLSLVLAVTIGQVGRSQFDVPPVAFTVPLCQAIKPTATHVSTCKVYSLADLGDDPNLCKWLAETLPEVIQPGSWKQTGVKLSYYAPAKVLVINHSPAVHTQVDEFLQSLRKSLPQQRATAKATRHDPQVIPAQFAVPEGMRPLGAVQTGPSSYPVPYPPQTPKHLFHFIIRYEGEGIIDSNVVKFAKALQDKTASGNNPTSSYAVPAVPPPPPNSPVVGVSSPPFTPSPQTFPAPAAPNSPPVMPPADAPAAPSGSAPVPPPPVPF
jgi:hypothetical protein